MRKDDRESRHRHPRRILDGAEELGHRARAEIATVKHHEMNITLFVTGNEKRLVSCDTRRLGFVSTGLYLIVTDQVQRQQGAAGAQPPQAGTMIFLATILQTWTWTSFSTQTGTQTV